MAYIGSMEALEVGNRFRERQPTFLELRPPVFKDYMTAPSRLTQIMQTESTSPDRARSRAVYGPVRFTAPRFPPVALLIRWHPPTLAQMRTLMSTPLSCRRTTRTHSGQDATAASS